jgi:hypothetical protein
MTRRRLMEKLRAVATTAFLGVAVFGMAAVLAPLADAGRRGGGTECPCAHVIEPAPGVICTLDFCAELVPGGFECGYVCTLPF